MKINESCSKQTHTFITGGALLISSVAVVVLFATAILPAQTRQGEVAARGAKVMPFDLEQTTHVFQKLDDGGLQKVLAGFQQQGLAEQASSWLGTGANEPISAADVRKVVSSDELTKIAGKLGIS